MKTPPETCNSRKLDSANLKIEFEHSMPPSVFSSLFLKLIYYILNMKNQIPYPVGHLYNLWKKELEKRSNSSLEASCFQEYERDAVSAYETMNEIQKHLLLEFRSGTVEEIALVIGSSTMLSKDVYRFILPACLINCVEDTSQKYDKCFAVLLKQVTECTDLQNILTKVIAPTKIFFFLKKIPLPFTEHSTATDWLLPLEDLNLYPMKSTATIEFAMKAQVEIPKFNVFEDSLSPDSGSKQTDVSDTYVLQSISACAQQLPKWYQSLLQVNGFKAYKEKKTKTHTFIKLPR